MSINIWMQISQLKVLTLAFVVFFFLRLHRWELVQKTWKLAGLVVQERGQRLRAIGEKLGLGIQYTQAQVLYKLEFLDLMS